ncbi:MAG: sulfatase-like hydrolase/transferase [Verrucomicrobiota bacterium]
MKRPNILLTIADDQRGTALGCAGVEPLETPHLDALAAAGTRYRQAQHFGSSHGAICAPSRAMLHTGQAYFDLDRSFLGGTYPPEDREVPTPATLGARLQEAGYQTFATGKWHNGTQLFQASFADAANVFFGGMDDHWFTSVQDYDPTGAYPPERRRSADGFSTEVFAQSAIDFIHRQAGSAAPFFCYCAFTAPHDPRTPPDRWRRRYDPHEMPVFPNMEPAFHDPGSPFGLVPVFDNGTLLGRDEALLGPVRDIKEVKRAMAAYYGLVSHMDEWIGKIHEALRETGFWEDTLVVHTADHGLGVGQHGYLGKQNMYQHSMQVPLILAGPGFEAGRVTDELRYQQDLNPTLLEAAGAAPAGASFRPLGGEAYDALGGAFGAHTNLQRCVRDERFKLMELSIGGRRRTELYDLEADPWEVNNLAARAEMAPVLARLRRRLRQWQEHYGDHAEWRPGEDE